MSIIFALLFLLVGQLLYLVPALLGLALGPQKRQRIGRYYAKQAMRSYERLCMVRRRLSGWDLMPISLDDERRLAQVTLNSGMLSGKTKLPFRDPADRIHRLFSKSVTIVPGPLPAVVDPKMAEVSYWIRKEDHEGGFVKTREADDGSTKKVVDPTFTVPKKQRFADPLEALGIRTKATEPEQVETVRRKTKERFSEYAGRVGAMETVGVLTGFVGGAGTVLGIAYVRDSLLEDGQTSTTPSGPVNVTDPQQLSVGVDPGTVADMTPALADAAVHVLGGIPA